MTPEDNHLSRPEDDPTDDGAGGYQLAGAPVETPRPAHPPTDADPAEADEPPEPPRGRPPLPPKPFLVGTFSFPLSPGAWIYAVEVSLAAALVLYPAAKSVELSRLPLLYEGLTQLSGHLACAMLTLTSVILGLMWFTFASGCALTIVRETANGVDRIGDWPGLAFLSYLLTPLYLFNSFCVSMLSGVVFSWLLGRGWLGGIVGSTVTLLLFPIILLSTLETGTPLGVASWPVWRTFVAAGRGWVAFYGTSTAVLAVVGVVLEIAKRIDGLVGILVAAVALTAGWFIYFRLLGRLAWYCTDHMASDESEEEEEDQEVEEMDVEGAKMVPFTFVFCPKCAYRVEIGHVPVGAEILCAGCGLEFVVEYE